MDPANLLLWITVVIVVWLALDLLLAGGGMTGGMMMGMGAMMGNPVGLILLLVILGVLVYGVFLR